MKDNVVGPSTNDRRIRELRSYKGLTSLSYVVKLYHIFLVIRAQASIEFSIPSGPEIPSTKVLKTAGDIVTASAVFPVSVVVRN